MVYRIALEGGPGGGKSLAAVHLQKVLTKLGCLALCVPEVPTIWFNSGIDRKLLTDHERWYTFEEAVVDTQLLFENAAEELLRKLRQPHHRHLVLLLDRGLIDPKIYMKPECFEQLLCSRRLTLERVMKSYHLVIHMVSAADGVPEHYSNANNASRSENLDYALSVEEKTLWAWEGHPNRVIIPNVVEGQKITFDEKLKLAENAVVEFLSKEPRK